MTDIFEEAEENLRAEAWMDIAKKSAPLVAGVLGGALALALGYWGITWWQDDQSFKASETYETGIVALSAGTLDEAEAQFTQVSKTGTTAYKALALMQVGGLKLKSHKDIEAVKAFDAASKLRPAPLIADAAAMKAAYIRLDDADLAEMTARLEPLTKDGHPFIALAKETLAMAKLKAGNVKGAKIDLQNLAIGLNTPESVKQRASIIASIIDSGEIEQARLLSRTPIPDAPFMPPQAMAGQEP